MYNKIIRENFFNPVNAGNLKKADASFKLEDVTAGEVIKLYIKLDEEGYEIIDAKFKACGSPVVIACANIACDMLLGRTLEQALSITHLTLSNALGEVPVEKIASLKNIEKAIIEVVNVYKKKNDLL